MTITLDVPLIGVINAGSSSLKFSIYAGEKRLIAGNIDGIGVRPNATATDANGDPIAPLDFAGSAPASPSEVLPAILPWARQHLGSRHLTALGHRVVHGGMHHSKPARVTPELLAELEALVPLAPLHEPHNLAPIRTAMQLNPELPQVACFDTAFHRTAPELEQAFALPYTLYEEGIRRYGFHGLSYEYIASVLPETAPEIADGRGHRRTSWQWLLSLCDESRSVFGNNDGVYCPRRDPDGHPLRRARPGCRFASHATERA